MEMVQNHEYRRNPRAGQAKPMQCHIPEALPLYTARHRSYTDAYCITVASFRNSMP